MRYESNENPKRILQTEKGFEINYDFEEIEKEERTVIEFSKIIVERIDYGLIVSAVIHSKYTVDDEIALRNNFVIEGESPDWLEYLEWREHAKNVARGVII